MTKEQAQALGYRVVVAGPFEIGLVKGDQGCRTWWGNDFQWRMPELDHPWIMDAILAQEQMEAMFGPRPPNAN